MELKFSAMKSILTKIGLLSSIMLLLSCSQRVYQTNTPSVNSLKVMSYNIHHANPPSVPGKIDLDAIAKAISDQNPDLVALQEVDVNTDRSGKINEASMLALKLGMKGFFFAKAIDHEGGDYGVAILSKYPISESKIHRLPTQEGTKGEPRVLATVQVNLPGDLPGGKKIRFGSTHLDAQKSDINRLLQLTEINKIAAQERLPFIIAGDLNATPESAVIKMFDTQFNRSCQNCAFTIPVINPTKAIDFIAYSKGTDMEVVSHEVVPERYASDHLPIVSVLKFK
jgi:endonuclease/exonuclease/phosphatase family metal-dependent hydrolase